MNHELIESPVAITNHGTIQANRQDILTQHEFSDIPMHSLPKKPIDWSQTPQQPTIALSTPIHLSAIDSDNIQEGEVVIIEESNNNTKEEEIDAVAQVLDDWDPMAEEHSKEKRKLKEITPETGNSLTIHFQNLPLSLSKESFCNMLKRAGNPTNLFLARHKQKQGNFAYVYMMS
ncbi:hypothetical protein LOD99_1318 [Oopsacas minuta]|uniref:Uncharacterized protein n=1 Tax=Oopsacas minuta TaxID=111878 RepID=A0AAV7K5L1_9METZ|nr:hypothetical protein LOD99_1318 [Oopsacas minuta]